MIKDELLSQLTKQEFHELKKECISNHDLDALLSLSIYRFKHGNMAMHEFVIPEMAYYFGRKHDEISFSKLLEKYLGPLILSYPKSCLDLSDYLFTIGTLFPNIPDVDLDKLESLYLDEKYFNLIDTILFDKHKLPRTLRHFDVNSLPVSQVEYSDALLSEIYDCFVKNEEIEEEKYKQQNDSLPSYFYNRYTNSIELKNHESRKKGEFFIELGLHCKDFHSILADKYGTDFSENFAQAMNFVPNTSWQVFMTATYFWPRIQDIEIGARNLHVDLLNLEFRNFLAKKFLDKCNNIK